MLPAVTKNILKIKKTGSLACLITLIVMHSGHAEFLNVCFT